jgi:hypothetical protein
MLVFLNPQVDDFMSTPPHFIFGGRKALKKYGFYFKQSVRNNEKIYVCVDNLVSCFVPSGIFLKLPGFLRRFICSFEIFLWLRANPELVKNIKFVSPEDISKEHILFMFTYKNALVGFQRRLLFLNNARLVVAHLSHYFIQTSLKSNNLMRIDRVILAGDSDISGNYYFRRFFNWYKKDFCVLHFALNDRFLGKFESTNRGGLAVTGTFHNLALERPKSYYSDFRAVMRAESYHYARADFATQRGALPSWVKVRCSPFRDVRVEAGNKLLSAVKRLGWSAQKDYFSFDILEFYVESSFALVGEEVTGFPAVGIFEAGASGCVMLCKADCYLGIPLKEDQHFLSYSGDMEDALSVIRRCSNSEDLERLRLAGQSKVRELFSPTHVYEDWNTKISLVGRDDFEE